MRGVHVCSVLEELLDHFVFAAPKADHVHVFLVFLVKATTSQHDGRKAQVDVCSSRNEKANHIEPSIQTSNAKSRLIVKAQRVYVCALLEEELDDV